MGLHTTIINMPMNSKQELVSNHCLSTKPTLFFLIKVQLQVKKKSKKMGEIVYTNPHLQIAIINIFWNFIGMLTGKEQFM